VGPAGSYMVREATRDCRVVLLTATEAEAAPFLEVVRDAHRYEVATKIVVMGEVEVEAEVVEAPERGGRRTLPVVLAITGCDKANVAHALTCLLQAMTLEPRLVVQFGIAGAFAEGTQGPRVGDLVLATRETYSDTGSSSPEGWLSAVELGLPIACVNGSETGGIFPFDAGLVGAAAAVVEAAAAAWGRPGVFLGPCVTASRVTGLRAEAEEVAARWGALAESMEGAAAAHICALYGVPFLEIRGISNLVDDRDRASWQVERAVEVAAGAALAVVAAVDRLPLGGGD
jgi:futalosine hydrolase